MGTANTTGQIVCWCARDTIPVGADLQQAIEAHKLVTAERLPQQVRWSVLTAVILATARTIEDDRRQLDCLVQVPECEWPPVPAPFCNNRENTLGMIRRSIAWRGICA